MNQKPRKGRARLRLSLCAERRIDRAVRAEAARYGVSLSFVQAVAIADAMGIRLEHDDRYKPKATPRKRRRVVVFRVLHGGKKSKTG
jgi:hypothetical protein